MAEGPLVQRDRRLATPPPEQARRPVVGYAMVLGAATLWGVNGTVSKVIIESGEIPSQRLTQIRTAGAFVGLAVVLALFRPTVLRLRTAELPRLVLFGVVGLAFVQWFYFVAIERLQIGVALLIQYLAPLLVALWARFALHEALRRRIWAALALSLAGLGLLLQPWEGSRWTGSVWPPRSPRR